MEAPTIFDMISRISMHENGIEYNHEKYMATLYRCLDLEISQLTHEYCQSTAILFSKELEKDGKSVSQEAIYSKYFSFMFDHVLSTFSNEQIEKNILQ